MTISAAVIPSIFIISDINGWHSVEQDNIIANQFDSSGPEHYKHKQNENHFVIVQKKH